jgi:photosystem II stability/assembly factor-like uncharacterized protein
VRQRLFSNGFHSIIWLLTSLAAAATMAACGGGSSASPSGPPVQATGSLAVTVSGPSSGATATVTVSGPNGYSRTLTQTTTLTGLAAGTYSIVAPTLPGASGSQQVFVPKVTGNPATVTDGMTASAGVSYGVLSTVWKPVGPAAIKILNGIPAAGKLQAVAVVDSSPLVNGIPSVMYVGGGGFMGPPTESGVYRTTDAGATWTRASSGLTDPAVDALWLDQKNPNVLVAATFTAGLFQSTDGGSSWHLAGSLGSSAALLQIGTTLYAGTGKGVAASTDDGATWTVIEPTTVAVRSLGAAGTMIYAGLGNGRVLVQSTASGSWHSSTPTTTAGVTAESIAVNPANAQNAFVVEMAYYNVPDLYETADGGSTWKPISFDNAGGGPVSVQVTAIDPATMALYAGADVYFGKSTDGGTTWTQMAAPNASDSGAWWDERRIVPDAGGIAGDVMVAADQGLYLTSDGGSNWRSLNGNLTSSIVYVAAVHGQTILCTMQDLGPVSSFDGGKSWDSHQSNSPGLLEGGTALINPGNPQYAYIYTAAGFQFSSDGGYDYSVTGHWTQSAFPGYAGNSQLIAVDQQNPSIVYAAVQSDSTSGVQGGIYRSTDYGQTWTRESWPISKPVMVAIDPTNAKNIFVGQTDGYLKVSHDGGQSWNSVPVGISGGQVTSPVTLAVNPATPNVVLLGLSGAPTAGGGVLRSTDGGKTFGPANTGLDPGKMQPGPDSIFRLSYDPKKSGLAVATRFSGIYLSSDNGGSWIRIDGNAVPHTFTSATWDSGYLYGSTFGEGVLQLTLTY